MGMTMTQKILAKHAGLDTVEVGQLIEAKVDMVPVSYTHLDVYKRQGVPGQRPEPGGRPGGAVPTEPGGSGRAARRPLSLSLIHI